MRIEVGVTTLAVISAQKVKSESARFGLWVCDVSPRAIRERFLRFPNRQLQLARGLQLAIWRQVGGGEVLHGSDRAMSLCIARPARVLSYRYDIPVHVEGCPGPCRTKNPTAC